MKIAKYILIYLLLFQTAYSKVVIKDIYNRTVVLKNYPQRVIALGPGSLRIVTYLNATNKIIGIEKFEKKFVWGRPYILAHKKLLKLPIVAKGGPKDILNIEKIKIFKPDLLIISFRPKYYVENLQRKLKIPVIAINYGKDFTNFLTDQNLYKSIRIVGKALNKENRAEEVISFIKNKAKFLYEKTKKEKKENVYVGCIAFKGLHSIESSYSKWPPFTINHIISIVDNIKPKGGHLLVNKEYILLKNPKFIFIDKSGKKLLKRDLYYHKNFYKNLKAFKNHKIYEIFPYNLYNTNIGTALLDAYFIAKIIYPDKFKDLDIEKTAKEIYTFLLGKDVYPQMKKYLGGFKQFEIK